MIYIYIVVVEVERLASIKELDGGIGSNKCPEYWVRVSQFEIIVVVVLFQTTR